MPRAVKWTKDHTKFVFERFTRVPGEEDKWYYKDADKPGVRGDPANDPAKQWYGQVKGLPMWSDINLQIFRRNIKIRANEWHLTAHNPDNAGNGNVGPEDAPADDADANVMGAREGSDSEEEVSEVEVLETIPCDGNSISLAYLQCVYDTSDGTCAPTKKGCVILQGVSGWTLAEEKDKGDFVVLSDDGESLHLSITVNSKLFDMEILIASLLRAECLVGFMMMVDRAPTIQRSPQCRGKLLKQREVWVVSLLHTK